MARFVGTYVNKVDRKGRVSVPADFRAALAEDAFAGVVCLPAFTHAALEGGGLDLLEQAESLIEGLDPYAPERDAFSIAILAEARKLPFDADGRVLLPEEFRAHAGITEHAAFAGLGGRFHIWEPAAFEAMRADARRIALEKRGALSRRGKAEA